MRPDLKSAMVSPMTRGALRITLELRKAVDGAVHGEVRGPGESDEVTRFSGWLELLGLLETLCDSDVEVEAVAREPVALQDM